MTLCRSRSIQLLLFIKNIPKQQSLTTIRIIFLLSILLKYGKDYYTMAVVSYCVAKLGKQPVGAPMMH